MWLRGFSELWWWAAPHKFINHDSTPKQLTSPLNCNIKFQISSPYLGAFIIILSPTDKLQFDDLTLDTLLSQLPLTLFRIQLLYHVPLNGTQHPHPLDSPLFPIQIPPNPHKAQRTNKLLPPRPTQARLRAHVLLPRLRFHHLLLLLNRTFKISQPNTAARPRR